MRHFTLCILACALSLAYLCLAGCHTSERSSGNSNSDEDGVEWRNRSQIKCAKFIGLNAAWLLTAKTGEILRTTNGGATWDKLPAPQGDGLDVLDFIDEQRGWAISRLGRVYRTSDGGNRWAEIAELNPPGGPAYFMSAYNMVFTDEQHGWVTELFSMWRTEDGGESWERGLSPLLPMESRKGLVDVFFLTPQIGWACGSEGRLYHTSDGGLTWSSQMVAKDVDYFYQVLFLDERTGWLKTDNTVYRTVDGGRTWQTRRVAGDNTVTGLASFVSAEEGWVVGHIVQGNDWAAKSGRGLVLHTIDGGLRWSPIKVGENEPFFSNVHFIDASRGWLISRDNIYRTEDGGKTWNMVLKLSPISVS